LGNLEGELVFPHIKPRIHLSTLSAQQRTKGTVFYDADFENYVEDLSFILFLQYMRVLGIPPFSTDLLKTAQLLLATSDFCKYLFVILCYQLVWGDQG
jgi:hypothetical protein